MKTTIEIPDALFRRAKAKAAERGQSLKELVTEALQEKLAATTGAGEPGWMQGFGKLRRLRMETARVQARIAEAFESIELHCAHAAGKRRRQSASAGPV